MKINKAYRDSLKVDNELPKKFKIKFDNCFDELELIKQFYQKSQQKTNYSLMKKVQKFWSKCQKDDVVNQVITQACRESIIECADLKERNPNSCPKIGTECETQKLFQGTHTFLNVVSESQLQKPNPEKMLVSKPQAITSPSLTLDEVMLNSKPEVDCQNLYTNILEIADLNRSSYCLSFDTDCQRSSIYK